MTIPRYMENRIYNEDCLDTMRRMKDQSIDLVVTSPPYNMNLRIQKGKYTSRQLVEEFSTKYGGFADNLPLDTFYNLHYSILREILRVSRLTFYNIQIVTGSKRAFFKLIGDFADNLKEVIVWDKGHAQPAMHAEVLHRRTELLLVFDSVYPISRQFNEHGRFERGTLDDLWKIKPARRKRSATSKHGARFPDELVETILNNFSSVGDTVYDPFMGTGTTARGAQRMQRKYVGSEISTEYCEEAWGSLVDEVVSSG